MSSRCFIPCRSVGTHRISRNDAGRALLVNDELLTFTPTEYRLLCVLLAQEITEDSHLLEAAFSTSSADRCMYKTLERHIENIKAKLRPTGLSLRRIYRSGYALLSDYR